MHRLATIRRCDQPTNVQRPTANEGTNNVMKQPIAIAPLIIVSVAHIISASARCIPAIQWGRTWQLELCATPIPLFKGNISVADYMPLSSLLKNIKINVGIECRWCMKKSWFSINIWFWNRSLLERHVWSTFELSTVAYTTWASTISSYDRWCSKIQHILLIMDSPVRLSPSALYF